MVTGAEGTHAQICIVMTLVDPEVWGGALGLISSSFRQTFCQIISWRSPSGVGAPRLRNAGSATGGVAPITDYRTYHLHKTRILPHQPLSKFLYLFKLVSTVNLS